MTIITGSPAESPEILDGWKAVAIFTIRSLIGDLDNERYTNDRLIQSFQVCANLVMFDVDFPDDYVINLIDKTILPEPSNDFISLVCLKTACVLLTSEGRDIGCKVSMKDGPSTINIDKSELAKTLKDTTKNACEKYEQAMFTYRAEGSLGVAILGPHGQDRILGDINYREGR